MPVLTTIFFIAAAVAWIAAFVFGVRLVQHRKPDITIGTLMFRGHMFYSRDNFTDAGASAHRGFLLSVLGFALCVGAVIVSSLALAPPPGPSPTVAPR